MNSFEPGRRPYGLPVIPEGHAAPPAAYYQPHPDYGYPGESFEEDRFDPLKLLWYVVHYRWLIAAFLTAGLVAGVMITYLQTPLYRSTANVEILTTGAKVLQDIEVVTQSSDLRALETARLKMNSRDLARRVVFELNLTEDEQFLAPTPKFSLLNLVNRATGDRFEADLKDLDAETREAMAVGRVQGGLSVGLVRNTSVLAVSYSHADPKYAAAVANQVARSFIDQNVDKTSETSDLARQFIEEQVRETKLKLQASEKALVDYAKQEGITLTGDDASLIAQNISKLNAALADAIQERLAAERYREQVEAGNAASLPEVFQSESIQATKEKIAELKASYQEKLATLKPGFPEMRRIQAQINELQNQIDLEIESIANTVSIRFEQAQQKERGIQRELSELENQQREFQDKNIQYTILKREVDSSRSQYDSLIGKLNEVGVGSELKSTNASIIDLALRPGAPYTPRLSRNAIMALALFAAMAAALIYLLELMNNTFAVPDQIESELKLPVLGIIPRIPESEITTAFEDSKSGLSEAYRTLRTSLQFTGTENTMRSLLVTSSEPSEGKSTTAFKLANDFAALGRNVLLVDADLRKPRLHRFFHTDNAMGLSNLLSNVVRQGDVMSIFHKTNVPNITLLPAGTIPPNPVDLLTSQKMALTLHYCAKRFDLIIIDSPPVMGLSDAPILARQADATLMVVSSKQVARKAAKTACDRLKATGANVVGAALTKFAVDKLDYNYAYRYMHYSYYNYYSAAEQIEDHAQSGPRKKALPGQLADSVSGLFGRFLRRAA
ncbi:MAG: polysaccharide biosynthesis tyrosine autokinase [Pseudomonadota bacterium]|nr:polysaccharide biosynthesis tyrosine autokinase [Pseudomonadota bacterium]